MLPAVEIVSGKKTSKSLADNPCRRRLDGVELSDEERRRLGITEQEHERLLYQLLAQWKSQGKRVTIDRFEKPDGGEASA